MQGSWPTTVSSVKRSARILLVVVGVFLVAFALLVTFYANEPFNVATIFGLVGVGLIIWARRRGPAAKS